MKKIFTVALIAIMVVVLSVSASAETVANHLFDKLGTVDQESGTWSVYGWIVTDADVTEVYYMLDGGEPVTAAAEIDTRLTNETKKGVTDVYRDLTLEQVVKDNGMYAGVSWDVLRAYRIQLVIDLSGLAEGSHTLSAFVKFANGVSEPAFRQESTFKFNTTDKGSDGMCITYLFDDQEVTSSYVIAEGWAGATVPAAAVGYRVDGGDTIYNDYVKLIKLDITNDDDVAVLQYAGQYGFRFSVDIPRSSLPEGNHEIQLVIRTKNGGELTMSKRGAEEVVFFASGIKEVVTEAVDTQPGETQSETQATETKTAETEETKTSENKGGLSTGAIIAIIVAAVAVVAAVCVIVVMSKKK